MPEKTPPAGQNGTGGPTGPARPVLIDLQGENPASPAAAPVVPEPDMPADFPTPSGQAMQTIAALGARKPSRLVRWFWALVLAMLGFIVSLAAWDYINALLARSPGLGYVALALTAAFLTLLLLIALREWLGFVRLGRVDGLRQQAQSAEAHGDLGAATRVVTGLEHLYRGRTDLTWGLARLRDHKPDILDADALLHLAESELLTPLDIAATHQIEAAARQVATVTAIVPLALADVVAAFTANMRMIRRIAEIYGGRAGLLGSWRLARAVLTHLVATGAVAIGDDLIGSVAGGGILSKVSRRFGEGVVNGALTARVGVAAMEVCRPLPFGTGKRPSVTGLVKRALAGLFGK